MDETGLVGAYDLQLRCANDNARAPSDGESAPSVFTALQETLGVNLERKKVLIEIVAVDRQTGRQWEN